jgi:hypothetical protein
MSIQERGSQRAPTWMRAIITATAMIVLTFVALVFVPNTLLGYLTTRVEPAWRDLIVVAWWMVAFVGCCVVFVRLQQWAGG